MKTVKALRLGAAALALSFAAVLTAGAQAPDNAPGPDGPGAGGPGFGQHRPPFERALGPHGDHGRFWNDPAVVEKLKLTDDQRKQMDEILQQHREKLVDLRSTVEKSELVLEPLMRADQPDENKILAQIDQVAQARAELEKANARFLLALRSKLTPEQWKQLQADRASRKLGEHRDFGPNNRQFRGGQDAPPPPGME
jgi:Spy/CpxP family protein refolding chaperone